VRADDQVLSILDWCKLNSFSESTGRRLIQEGKSPPVIRLSERRLGIRAADNREWQESRTKA
jgi:predicted DNA-binding transcriptional regulator AlpA